MNEKVYPVRTCIGCGKKMEKSELLRVIVNEADEALLDESGKANTRGAYVCNDEKCIAAMFKRKALNRAFKKPINTESLEKVLM